MLKKFITSGCLGLGLMISLPIFADEGGSSLDRYPSVDQSVNKPVDPPQPANQHKEDEDALPASEPLRAGSRSSYVYDLKKLINQSRSNIKEVNEKIKEQAILKRNQMREEKARQYYEKGQALTDEGRFDEARGYFEKAIRITEHPEMAGYIKDSQKKLKAQEAALRRESNERVRQLTTDEKSRQQDVDQTYQEAVALYREKKFRPAKEAFEHIEDVIPDYKATQSYLRIIDQDIIAQDASFLKEQKKEMERQQQEAEAARLREKEAWRKEIEQKEKARKAQLSKQAEDVYLVAVELYKQKKFKDAKAKFQEVAWVFPDYKATTNYLRRIDKDIEEFDKEQSLAQEKLLEKQRWEEEVLRRKQEEERQRQWKAQEKAKQQQLEEQAGFTYASAVKLFDQGQLDESLEKFNDIEKMLPGFKSTRVYIAKVNKIKLDKIRQEQEAKERQERLLKEKALQEERLAKEKAQQEERLKKEKALQEERLAREKAQQEERLKKEKAKEEERLAKEKAQQEKRLAKDKSRGEEDLNKEKARLKESEQQPVSVGGRSSQPIDQRKELESQMASLYESAMQDWREHRDQACQEKLEKINAQYPHYRQTDKYLTKVNRKLDAMKIEHHKMVDQGPLLPSPVRSIKTESFPAQAAGSGSERKGWASATQPAKAGMSTIAVGDQIYDASEIADLAEKAQALMRQLSSMTDDRSTVLVKKKVSQFNALIQETKERKDRALRDLREKMLKQEQARLKEQEQIRNQKAQDLYNAAIDLLLHKDFDGAKMKFLELENVSSNYKDTRRYLSSIEADKKKAQQDALSEQARQQEEQVRQARKQQEEEAKQKQIEEARRQQQLRTAQQEQVRSLSSRAVAINDEIIVLTKQQKYSLVKTKLAELQGVITSLKSLKDLIQIQEEEALLKKQQAKEIARLRGEAQQAQREEKEQVVQVKLTSQQRSLEPNRRFDETAQAYRRREEMRGRDMLYNQGVELYERRKFTQARMIFEELKTRRDRRALAWIEKIDRVINQEVLKYKKLEAQGQTDYVKERIRLGRKIDVIEHKESARQRKLAKEFERQRELAESRRQQERIRMEGMRAKDIERQRFYEKQEKEQEKRRQEQEVFRFRKVAKPVNAAVIKPLEVPAVDLERQRRDQKNFSKKRKAYFEDLSKKEQNQLKDKKAQTIAAAEVPVKKKSDRGLEKSEKKEKVEKKQKVERKEKAQSLKGQDKTIKPVLPKIVDDKKKQKDDLKHQQEKEKMLREEKLRQALEAKKKKQEDLAKQKKEKQEQEKQEIQRKKEQKRLQEEARLKEIEQKREQAQQEAQRKKEEKRRQEEARAQEIERKRLQAEQEAALRKQKEQEIQAQREEAKRKADLEAQIKERQARIETERLKIRKQMEAETDILYNQAMQLFQSGQYARAYTKFQDVEDALPSYKQARAMIEKCQQFLSKTPKPVALTLDPLVVQKQKATLVKPSPSPQHPRVDVSRTDAIKKTLDLFDTDVR